MEFLSELPPYLIDFLRLFAWLTVLIVIFVPLERIFALHHQPVFRKSFLTDLAYYFLSSLLPKLILVFPVALIGWALHYLVPRGLHQMVAGWPLLYRFAGALIAGEFGAYWGHRWSHELPFLWRFHSVHHSAEQMDWLVNTRSHPLDMVFTRLCRRAATWTSCRCCSF